MKKFICFIFILSVFHFGCTEGESHSKKTEEHDHDGHAKTLELNNGEKWLVNIEMTAPIKTMENRIAEFAVTGPTDYNELALGLQDDINLLVSTCTMSGKSHDELHKWLVPFMELVNELSELKDEKKAALVFGKINESMITYNQFFQ